MPKLYTHQKPDIDAFASLWVVTRFIPNMANAEIIFKSNAWDGSDMNDDDMAVDMNAGGHGIKGKKDGNRVMSAFALLMERYAPKRAQKALELFIKYLDLHDSGGSVTKQLMPHLSPEQDKMFFFSSIHMMLLTTKVKLKDDLKVFEHMCIFFDGLLEITESHLRNEVDFDEYAEILHEGKVGINRSGSKGMGYLLFERGVDIVIFVDGFNIGIRRREGLDFRMDHPNIEAVIKAAGEEIGEGLNLWYSHPTGYFCAHGTKTGPATRLSKVNPYDLAEAVNNLL